MRTKWMASLTAVACLGLATACERRGERQVEIGAGGQELVRDTGMLGPQGMSQHLAEHRFTGTIMDVREDQNLVAVRDQDGAERVFRVLPRTRILSEGQQVGLEQLSEGARVHTSYESRAGEYQAVTVEILQPAPESQ
jgi:hypothetical protein